MSCEEAAIPKEMKVPVKVGRKPTRGTEYKEKVNEFKYRVKGNTSLYEVYFEEGGVIPVVLSGLYTSPTAAKKHVDLYKANRRQYY